MPAQLTLAMLMEGLVSIVAGLTAMFSLVLATFALAYIIAFWAIATGILEISFAIQLRKKIKDEWLLVLGGIVPVLFGGALMIHPLAGALNVGWLIGL